MAKREQYSVALVCPKCGEKGRVNYEENENPIYGGGRERELVAVSGGFSKKKGDIRDDPDLICDSCGAIAHKGSN
jgi:hypothetical protein